MGVARLMCLPFSIALWYEPTGPSGFYTAEFYLLSMKKKKRVWKLTHLFRFGSSLCKCNCYDVIIIGKLNYAVLRGRQMVGFLIW